MTLQVERSRLRSWSWHVTLCLSGGATDGLRVTAEVMEPWEGFVLAVTWPDGVTWANDEARLTVEQAMREAVRQAQREEREKEVQS